MGERDSSGNGWLETAGIKFGDGCSAEDVEVCGVGVGEKEAGREGSICEISSCAVHRILTESLPCSAAALSSGVRFSSFILFSNESETLSMLLASCKSFSALFAKMGEETGLTVARASKCMKAELASLNSSG